MGWFFRTPETVTPELVKDEPDEAAPADTGWHCSWCGDGPDANGSHGICPAHEAQILAQSEERRAARRR